MSMLQDGIKGLQGVKDVASGAKRKPFDYTKIETEFLNGEHLDNPDGGPTVTIDAKSGPNKGASAGEIEIIHFGRVYIDVDSKFAHEAFDDNAVIDMADITGARAGMHRAALMRETLLQASYLRALEFAMDEAGKSAPSNDKDGIQMVDQLMGKIGDLVGGSQAGQLKMSTLDLNPLITKVNTIGAALNQNPISYPSLHKAGRDLHQLRSAYRGFLEAQNNSPPEPAPPAPGLLAGLPLIGDALKDIPVVGDILEWGDKIIACSFSLASRLTIEMHLKMEPSINAACREMSLDAIRNRRAPVFMPWWKFPPPAVADNAPPSGARDGMSIDFVKMVKDEIDPTLKDIDKGVKEYTSIFAREDKTTPGDAYLDMAFFLNPDDSPLGRSETMGSYGADALARVVGGAEGADTSFELPEIVKNIAGYVFRLCSEFVRAVYKKLLVVGDGFFHAPELAEAGRTHLLRTLTNWPLEQLDLNKYIDDLPTVPIPSLAGGDPVEVSVRNLFENLRDMLIEQLAFMDPVIAFATDSFYQLLLKTRMSLSDYKTRSMEPYLALIPTLHATMFRNVFLGFMEALRNAVKDAVADMLAPVLGALGADGILGDAFEAADTMQSIAKRADEAMQLMKNVGTGDIMKVAALGRDLDSTDKKSAFGDQGAVGVASPFGSRKSKVSAKAIVQRDRDTVTPDLKWDPDADVNQEGPDTEPPPPSSQDGNGGTP